MILEHHSLAPYTTLGLGGPARFFAECASESELRDALDFARTRGLAVHILGGGSNTIFDDRGYAGLVVRLTMQDVAWAPGDGATVTASAGVDWDTLVRDAVSRGLAGIECLSGIPGTAGATPIQNVGAYGQEVSQTIVDVTCLERASLSQVTVPGAECGFGYRSSRFKRGPDRDRYIILGVTFRLAHGGPAAITYPELERAVRRAGGLGGAAPAEGLKRVRETVLALRHGKAMVLDPADPNTRSAGSFFTNPVLSRAAFDAFTRRAEALRIADTIPSFPADGGFKVPAAWLVEHAGFAKGERRGGVGISERHALALVNYDGTSAELLALAAEIERAVYDRFGICLDREPVVVA